MKSKVFLILTGILLFLGSSAFAQLDELPKSDSAKFTGGAIIGAVTVDGKNYQQVAIRTDIPIGKFGFGLDMQILLDENGNIRKEDWDQWQDYLDKIYYIRFGKKTDPFYFKLGGLDYSYIGYSNIFNGYTNMLEYPTRKRYGGELSFYIPSEKWEGKPRMGAEFLFSDVKELFLESPAEPSLLFGTRVFFRPLKKLEIGVSLGADLNEYNAFLDRDGDGVPDAIDNYPSNGNWATDMDKISTSDWNHLLDDSYWGATRAEAYQNLLAAGLVPSDTTRMSDLFNLAGQTSRMYAASVDIGIPVIEREKFQFDIYSHFTQLKGEKTYGWGVALPGMRFIIGTGNVNNFLTLKAEYRRSSKEFMFGYFNNTYDIERAQFTSNGQVITKQQQLLAITHEMNGVYASAELNLLNYVVVYGGYQDLMGTGDDHIRSIHGELRMGETLKNMLHFADVKGYYIQNNVQDFKEWKTPSSLVGFSVGYNYKGAIVGLDYRWTFQDLDGNGIIRGNDETIKTISFRTAVTF